MCVGYRVASANHSRRWGAAGNNDSKIPQTFVIFSTPQRTLCHLVASRSTVQSSTRRSNNVAARCWWHPPFRPPRGEFHPAEHTAFNFLNTPLYTIISLVAPNNVWWGRQTVWLDTRAVDRVMSRMSPKAFCAPHVPSPGWWWGDMVTLCARNRSRKELKDHGPWRFGSVHMRRNWNIKFIRALTPFAICLL